jgi:type VI secretion system secreted protein Hcp
MAVDAYMYFQGYDTKFLASESQVAMSKGAGDIAKMVDPFVKASTKQTTTATSGSEINGCGLFEVEDYSFDIEQTLNIGSQSSGAGAGKVTFNPFSITRKIDCASPIFFQMACSGKAFQTVGLGIRKSAGNTASGVMYLVFTFKLVAVKTISWSHDDEAPKETVTLEYGGLNIQYSQQKPDGSLYPPVAGGWNRVKNVEAMDLTNANFDIK